MKLKVGDLLGVAYKICQVECNKVCLINLDSGRRWLDPIEVGDITCLSKAEVYAMMGDTDAGDWRVGMHAEGVPLSAVLDAYEKGGSGRRTGFVRLALDSTGEPVVLMESLSRKCRDLNPELLWWEKILADIDLEDLEIGEIYDLQVEVRWTEEGPEIVEIDRKMILFSS